MFGFLPFNLHKLYPKIIESTQLEHKQVIVIVYRIKKPAPF